MKLSTVFIVNAIVALVLGLASIIVPAQLAGIYGINLTEVGVALTRVIGANLIGYAAVAWLIRNAPASEARRAVVIGFFVGWVASTIIYTLNTLGSGVGAAGWFNVVFSLVFALAYAYFVFVKPDSA